MLNKNGQSKMNGYTLTEMLVSMVIGMSLLAGLLSLYVNTSQGSTNTLRTARLNHDMRSVMELMTSDIRRAGYSATAQADVGINANTNPFMNAASGWDVSINGPGNCILYTYDSDSNGTLSTSSPDERFGFRLNSTNNTIEMRTGGTNFACNSGTWEEIMDSTIVEITALSITESLTDIDLDSVVATTPKITIRNVTISVTGRLLNDTTVSRVFTESVRLRNDKYSS